MASYPLVENIYVMWLCQICSLETFQDGNRVTLLLFFLDHVCKLGETLSGCGWYKDSVFTLLLPNPRASAGPCQSSQFAVCWAKPWDLWQIQGACQSRVWIYLTGSSLEEKWFTSAHSCRDTVHPRGERGGQGQGEGQEEGHTQLWQWPCEYSGRIFTVKLSWVQVLTTLWHLFELCKTRRYLWTSVSSPTQWDDSRFVWSLWSEWNDRLNTSHLSAPPTRRPCQGQCPPAFLLPPVLPLVFQRQGQILPNVTPTSHSAPRFLTDHTFISPGFGQYDG